MLRVTLPVDILKNPRQSGYNYSGKDLSFLLLHF